MTKLALACMVLGGSALMAACGGGGGGGSAAGGGTTAPSLTLKGTAAVGAAVAGGAISVTCKTGSGAGTSNLDGTFTVTVTNGAGPCLLSITPSGGTPLYSFTTGNGESANITPMTNLLVGYLLNVPGMTAADPLAWFALPATKALLADTAAINARVVNDFIPSVKALLPSLSISDTSFLSTPFTASPSGSATDADLEKLKNAQIVSSTGAPSASATASLKAGASNDATVPPAPAATGAGS